MKRQIFLISIVVSLFSSLSAETVIKYSDGLSLAPSKLNALPLRSEKHPTTISSVTIKAPSNGSIVVESSGKGCIHTDNKFMDLMLQKDSKTVSHNSFGWLGHGGACAMGEVQSYSFRHVEKVKKGLSYTYKLVAQRGRTKGAISGNIYIGNLVAIFYPDKKINILLPYSSFKLQNIFKDIHYNKGEYSGENNIKLIELNRTESIIKMNVPEDSLPQNPSVEPVDGWLNIHAQRLLNIISSRVQDKKVMVKYEQMESKLSTYDKINHRVETIHQLLML